MKQDKDMWKNCLQSIKCLNKNAMSKFIGVYRVWKLAHRKVDAKVDTEDDVEDEEPLKEQVDN